LSGRVPRVLLAVVTLFAGSLAPAGARSEPAAAARGAQWLDFHGWSPDSRYIAYTRHHPTGSGPEEEAPGERTDEGGWTEQRMHRKVVDGELKGFGRKVGKDVAAHARAAGYVNRPLAREATGPGAFVFRPEPTERTEATEAGLPPDEPGAEPDERPDEPGAEPDERPVSARPLTLEVEVGRGLGFRVARGDRVLFRHAFDRLYIGFEPAIYPSPNGCQALLVFHLDTGWEVDAAIFTFPLVRSCP
jgi:hypothetical protein